MKKVFNVFLGATMVLMGACSKQSAVSPKEATINSLTASSWKVQSVTNDPDGDLTFQYENFSLALSRKPSGDFSGEYFVANGGNAFPSSNGKWSLSDDLKTIHFDNGETIQMQLSDNQLRLDFYITGTSGRGRASSRVDGLSGHFVFVLKH